MLLGSGSGEEGGRGKRGSVGMPFEADMSRDVYCYSGFMLEIRMNDVGSVDVDVHSRDIGESVAVQSSRHFPRRTAFQPSCIPLPGNAAFGGNKLWIPRHTVCGGKKWRERTPPLPPP